MRFCGECGGIDFRKTPPCRFGYQCYKSEKSGELIRPSKCKRKIVSATKARLQSVKNAKNRAIDAFQLWIRYRDNWTCCVCGKRIDPSVEGAKQLMHAGHYISRRYKSLLLDPKNCNAQCKDCNGRQNWEGVDPRYTKYIVNKYGPEILDYLYQKQHEAKPISNAEWAELADFWEGELEKEKKRLTN